MKRILRKILLVNMRIIIQKLLNYTIILVALEGCFFKKGGPPRKREKGAISYTKHMEKNIYYIKSVII